MLVGEDVTYYISCLIQLNRPSSNYTPNLKIEDQSRRHVQYYSGAETAVMQDQHCPVNV